MVVQRLRVLLDYLVMQEHSESAVQPEMADLAATELHFIQLVVPAAQVR